MQRGRKPISRDQAIQFCRDRKQMHLNGADKIRAEKGIDQDLARAKFNAQKDLALIYGDIADMLEGIAKPE